MSLILLLRKTEEHARELAMRLEMSYLDQLWNAGTYSNVILTIVYLMKDIFSWHRELLPAASQQFLSTK